MVRLAPATAGHAAFAAQLTGQPARALRRVSAITDATRTTIKAMAYYADQVVAGTASQRVIEGFMERIQTLQRLAEARPERLARRGMRRSYERYLRRKAETARAVQTVLPFGEAN